MQEQIIKSRPPNREPQVCEVSKLSGCEGAYYSDLLERPKRIWTELAFS